MSLISTVRMASTIARMLGIGDKRAKVLIGKEIEVMDDEVLFRKVGEVSVYARVAPPSQVQDNAATYKIREDCCCNR